jgi:hypothetical protein
MAIVGDVIRYCRLSLIERPPCVAVQRCLFPDGLRRTGATRAAKNTLRVSCHERRNETFSLAGWKGLMLQVLFLRGAGSQSRGKTLVGGPQTTVNLIEVQKFGSIDLVQGCLDGLNLQHTIGNDFTF